MKKSLKALPLVAVMGLGLSAVVPVFAQEGEINVISREEGSGTRGAFVEIVGVVNDKKDDMTTDTADIQNGTSGVMQAVAGNPQAIGYISLGSLDDSIKALKVDGVEATAENVKSGDYKISRPFNVVWPKDGMSDLAKDFLSYIHSKEGQAIVEAEKYISVTPKDAKDQELKAYEKQDGLKGQLNVVGSTSVTPLMEKLAEEYQKVNPDVKIEITSNGSTAGIQAAEDKSADLGMASRELKDEEKAKLDADAIALDGIAVIVNKESKTEDITLENIKKIFLGEITEWEEVK
ncbi:substrate-binding domain-containing protein [Vaginisenegalia massiliensis]|uniref:substrate-binding domain-containing protein n=1 Tax=Vaginisenegalia massiliensis TaxID=2058294 RepID=UPI000F51F681|nr:substrate-binding domain-containing protein [Vaginisenegalia massiliensis]